MRHAAALIALLLIGPAGGAVAADGDDRPPLPAMIVAMAQHFVQDRFMFDNKHHYHIEFDVAQLHPQPSGDFWAVVGGFVSDQNTPNTFVAAVRLICPRHEDVGCWRLEKLAINGEILLNMEPPL